MANYVITYTSVRLLKQKIKDLISSSEETIYFDMTFTTISDILQEASYHSLFQDRKNIVVYKADFFGSQSLPETESQLLQKYLEQENDLTTIIFVTNQKISPFNILYRKLKAQNHVIDLLSEKVVVSQLIFDYCRQNKFSIEKEAIEILKIRGGDNYDFLFSELDKLFLYYAEPQLIKTGAVQKFTSNLMEEKNFKLVTQVIERDYEASFIYLKHIKPEPLPLFSLLIREFRLLLIYKKLAFNNTNLQKMIQTYNLKSWQLNKINRNASKYQILELEQILKILAEYDYLFKSGKVDSNLFLQLLLLEIYSI